MFKLKKKKARQIDERQKIPMWYELKWELRVAQREASVWKTWRQRDSHGEATKRQRPVSDRQCGPPTQRVSGHPWGVRAKEGQTWPLSSCRRLAQSGTRNQSWVCLWVHVWTAQSPSWYWFYCSVLLKRTYKTQTFSRIAQHHIDWQLMEGAARDHSRVNVLCYCCFVFFSSASGWQHHADIKAAESGSGGRTPIE